MELYIKEIDGNKGRLFFDRQCKRPCLNLDTKLLIELLDDKPDLSDSVHLDKGVTIDDCCILRYGCNGSSVYYYGKLLSEVEKIANEKIHNYLNEVIDELNEPYNVNEDTLESDFKLQLNMSYDEFVDSIDSYYNIKSCCDWEYTDDTEENVNVTFYAGEFCMDYLDHQSQIKDWGTLSILVDNKGDIKTIDDREYFLNTTSILTVWTDDIDISDIADDIDIFTVLYNLFSNMMSESFYTTDIDINDIFTMEENDAFSLYSGSDKLATITLIDSDTPTFMLSLPGGLSGKFSTLAAFRNLLRDTEDLYDCFFDY